MDRTVIAVGLVLDGDSIYVSDFFGAVVRVPKNGEPSQELFVSETVIPGPIAADATMLYFLGLNASTGMRSVYSLSKAGGMPVVLATGIETPMAIAVDNQNIYWLDLGTLNGSAFSPNGKVERVTKSGESRQTLASNLSAPLAMAIDSTDVYFGETGLALGTPSAGLRKVPKSGGTITKLTDGRAVTAIEIVGAEAFYASAVTPDGSDPQITRMALGGGTSTVLYRDLLALNLHVDDGNILIIGQETNEIGFLASIRTSGGPTRILRRAVFDSYDFAFDACAVYYGASAGLERSPR
jgi:hypothetical protein